MNKNKIICAIDIGTTKVVTLISEFSRENNIYNILGVGISPSHGLKQGIVVNMQETANSIGTSVNEAEDQADIEIDSAYVGISGKHIKGINYSGVTSISNPGAPQSVGQEITKNDINRVLEQAKSINVSSDRRIMHILPQKYKIDNMEGIDNPLGLSGHRLEANVHIVTSAINTEKDISTCMNQVGIKINAFILEPLASSYAALDSNEKELGSILIDIGGGTTDVIIFNSNSVLHTGIIPIGGANITKDIAYAIQTSTEQAELLKCEYGNSKVSLSSDDNNIIVKGIGGRKEYKISQKILAEIIEPRMEEIFNLAREEIFKSDFKGKDGSTIYTFGVVLTGGGSQMANLEDLATTIFEMPVKVSSPVIDIKSNAKQDKTVIDLRNPKFSTVLGIVEYVKQMENNSNINEYTEGFLLDVFNKIYNKIKSIIK